MKAQWGQGWVHLDKMVLSKMTLHEGEDDWWPLHEGEEASHSNPSEGGVVYFDSLALLASIWEIGFKLFFRLIIVVIGFQKPYTKTEVGVFLELYDVYWRLVMQIFNVGSKYLEYITRIKNIEMKIFRQ